MLAAVLMFGTFASAVPVRAAEEEKEKKIVSLVESRSGEAITFVEENAVQLDEGKSQSFLLNVPSNGEYWLSICYRAIPGRQINPEATISVTGQGQNYENAIYFARRWLDVHTNSRFEVDSNDNEVLPKTEEEVCWQQAIYGISADTGSGSVTLEKGEYEIAVSMISEAVEIGDVRLISKESKPYATYFEETKNKEHRAQHPVVIEAEIIYAKSDSSIIASYDRSSPTISPNYPDKIALNIVGGNSYANQGQWIEWQFEIEEAGYYSVDLRYQQDALRELGVGRKIYIDGVIPFDEFGNYLFPYGQSYEDMTLASAEGDPYYLYLQQGTHTIRMEVSETHLEKSIIELKNYINECNSMYRKIISITGANPDVYRDYYLDKELPELIPFLTESIDRLTTLAQNIEQGAEDGKGSETTVLYDTIRTYNRFIEKPYKIPANLSEFKNRIDAMAELILTLETQALTLDYITLNPMQDTTDVVDNSFWGKIKRGWNDMCESIASFFKYVGFRLQSFLASFSGESKTTSGNAPKKITVWINMGDMLTSGSASGRDQMQIIRQLADESFVTENNISVEFSLVSAGDTLSQAVLAGKGPDVCLFVGEQTVANLGMRGVLADLSQMEGFSRIQDEIYDSALIPFSFNGGVYAIPETQNFNMMFVRDDIFEELGLEVPNTWDEFYAVEKKLAEKKLEIGISESQDIFEMFLMQHGASIYNDDCTASGLKSQASVEAFTQWTDLYTKHSLPLTFSFLNRFRTGEMPMGIMSYTMYNQLVIAAPEIKGQWSMYPVPATVQEDGTLNRSQSSYSAGCVVIDSTENKDAAFAFIDWWTNSSTQAQFGRQVESVLGKAARYNTANSITFEQLNWSTAELEVLKEARRDVSDTPQTIVTYYVARCVSNAFRRVVYSYEKPRDVIYRYSDDLDLEFERKKEVMEAYKK